MQLFIHSHKWTFALISVLAIKIMITRNVLIMYVSVCMYAILLDMYGVRTIGFAIYTYIGSYIYTHDLTTY
jgi:hypothetical protein